MALKNVMRVDNGNVVDSGFLPVNTITYAQFIQMSDAEQLAFTGYVTDYPGIDDEPVADDVIFDNTGTDLVSNNVNDAIVEVNNKTKINYSTTEHVIGTWIDGKTLYEKTVSCGALPNATTKSVDMGISDTLDAVWVAEGFAMVSSTNSSVPLPNVSTNTSAGVSGQTQIILRKTTKKIEINCETDRRDFNSSYITIRYTKATS